MPPIAGGRVATPKAVTEDDAMTEAEWLACTNPTPMLEHFRRGDAARMSVRKRRLTSTAVTLARSIYAERAFDRLPILADALEDAGCDAADLLAHCRGDGPHVRGCWAVDLVLGKG